ncbi:MAG: oligosaccharide flippase family protein [Bacteroidia bacterium]|nr:oligosaccharide flippase family protein [Bacteroidia bacterium]MDW8347339.1 oligosaccharide flippase family protein [Bacteroidia bacterium]
MLKSFFKNVSFMLALNLAIKPLWVLCEIWIQNRVGDTEYGLYSATFSLCMILGITLDLGINQMITREIARDNQVGKSLFSEAFGVKLMLIPVFFGLAFIAATILHYNSAQIKMLAILSTAQVFTSLLLFMRAGFQGLHYFKQDSLLSVLDRGVLIVGLVILLLGTQFNIFFLGYMQIVAYVATFLIALITLQKKSVYVCVHFSKNAVKRILKKTTPYAMLWLFMTIYTRIDSVMLEWLLRDTQNKDFGKYMAGVYASAYRLMDFSNTIPIMFATILFPVFTSLLDKKKVLEVFVKNVLVAMILITMVIVSCCTFYAKDILSLLYKAKGIASIELATPVFIVLMWAYICFVLIYVFGTLLTSAEALYQLCQITVVGAIISVILNVILIPKFYALGASVALLVTQILMVILHVFLCQKRFSFVYGRLYVLKIVVFMCGSFLIGYATTFLPLIWLFKMFVNGFFVLIFAFAIRFVSKETFVMILKRR